MKRVKLIGYILYYLLFTTLVVVGTMRSWPILLPILIWLLVLLLIAGSGRNHFSNFHYHMHHPMLSSEDALPISDEVYRREIPLSAVGPLIIPPLLYFLFVLALFFLS